MCVIGTDWDGGAIVGMNAGVGAIYGPYRPWNWAGLWRELVAEGRKARWGAEQQMAALPGGTAGKGHRVPGLGTARW